jgi:hypothetical protein
VSPTVTSDIYPAGSVGCPADGCGGVGQTGSFTFASSSDVASYQWWFVGEPPTTAVPAAVGAPVTVKWTPTSGGAKSLSVKAIDRAGRTAVRTYQFVVAGPAPAVARWKLDDPAGATTLADDTGNGHSAALSRGTLGVAGLVPGGGTAIHFDGGLGNGAAAPHLLDTGRSFSVAAWVRNAETGANRAFVSEDGVHSASFQLQYGKVCGCWAFTMLTSDVALPDMVSAQAPGAAPLNVWTHLVGVYDAGLNKAQLYVNGVLVASTTGPAAPWNATGALTIGRSRWNDMPVDFVSGDIAQVQVWNRVLMAGEISAMSDPLAMGEVGEWHMDEVGPGPAFDSSGMYHDLTFHGGASIPPAGSGQTGTGLHLDGATGYADTTGPVVYTDQSYTVSAWIRLADADPATPAPDLPGGNRTAVGQSGQTDSAFFLGYRMFSGVPHWSFSMLDADTDNTAWVLTMSPAAVTTADVGRWVHLVGVFDATNARISLYVNGTLAASAPRTARWHANGPLTIGTALWSPAGGQPRLVDWWPGDIDEVRVYAGAVADVTRIP